MTWSSWELMWGVLGPLAELQLMGPSTNMHASTATCEHEHGARGHHASAASRRQAAQLLRLLSPAGSKPTAPGRTSSGSSSCHLRAEEVAVACAASSIAAHSERAQRVSPVPACRAVQVLPRSWEAGMDVWERGSTLMRACKRGGKHAQQHSTAQEGPIAARSPQQIDQLQQLPALAMCTFTLKCACTKCSPSRDEDILTSPASCRRAPRPESQKFGSTSFIGPYPDLWFT